MELPARGEKMSEPAGAEGGQREPSGREPSSLGNLPRQPAITTCAVSAEVVHRLLVPKQRLPVNLVMGGDSVWRLMRVHRNTCLRSLQPPKARTGRTSFTWTETSHAPLIHRTACSCLRDRGVMSVIAMPSGAKVRTCGQSLIPVRSGRVWPCWEPTRENVMVGTPQNARHHPGEPPAARVTIDLCVRKRCHLTGAARRCRIHPPDGRSPGDIGELRPDPLRARLRRPAGRHHDSAAVS